MKKLFYLICLIALGFNFTACNDDDDEVIMVNANLKFTTSIDNVEYKGVVDIKTLTLKNINTGEIINGLDAKKEPETAARSNAEITCNVFVPQGVYTIDMEGTFTYQTVNEEQETANIRAFQEAVEITPTTANMPLSIKAYFYNPDTQKGGFVISEIFVNGTQTTENKPYLGDSYFKIYNNSNETLCADGLTIAESKFTSTLKFDYEPNIMDEAFAAQAIYRIPLGKKLMVAPGESIILCDRGLDHREINSNSFDLTKADFEWFDENSNPKQQDVDTETPNLEKIYCYTNTIWIPSKAANRTYVLARLGENEAKQLTAEEYIKDYKYDYSYVNSNKPMKGSAYKIPNKWILDAVNLSTPDKYKWILTSPLLDKGWNGCGMTSNDPKRFGKCIRRRILNDKELQDTNNSSLDFLKDQIADPAFKY